MKREKISGYVMCFNEWDPTELFPQTFEEIANIFPDLSFEGEIDTCADDDSITVKFSYKEFHLKITTEFKKFYCDCDEGQDLDAYEVKEQDILIKGNLQTTLEFPKGIKVIKKDMIKKSTHLVSIEIPEGVTEIEEYAFCKCKKLEKVILPKSLKKIGGFAFYECTKLKEIVLPEQLKSIGEGAFCGCVHLKEMIIPEGITKLLGTFCRCKNLISISLPSSLRYISSGVCTVMLKAERKNLWGKIV